MTRHIATAVILAAGSGSRIGELGKYVPKPLLPILNEPLIRRNVRWLKRLGVERIEIVVGHLGGAVRRALEEDPLEGMEIGFTEQKERLGIAHALGQLDGVVREPFILLLGDYAFEAPELDRMLRLDGSEGCLLSAKEESDMESLRRNFSIEYDADGLVTRVREKPEDPPNRLKGCGIYTFDERVFEAVRKTQRSPMRNEYEITESIQRLIDAGVRTRFLPVVTWDMNLTYPADLLECNLHFLGKGETGVPRTIMSDLPAGSIFERSVVGRGVRAAGPVQLRESVVFDGAVFESAGSLTRSVAFGSHVVQC